MRGVSTHESQPSTHLKHRPTHHTKPSPPATGAPFFTSTTPRHQDGKRHPVPNLCILLSISILSRLTAISTSPLPAPPCPYMSSRKPIDSLAHDRLWSLITNTQLTNSHKIFEGALFHLQNTLEPVRKKAPPILILPSVSANFTP